MLWAVNHCVDVCGVRLLVSFFLFPAALRILCAFAENVSPCAKMGPPMDRGALRTARALHVGRDGAVKKLLDVNNRFKLHIPGEKLYQ